MNKSALVSDFDGTITEVDFYALIAQRHMQNGDPDYFGQYREGRLSHVQAMQSYFQHAPSDPDAPEKLLRDTRPDPDLRAACDGLERGGWDLIIVSAGSSWYIERILSRLGIHATVHSNPGEIVPGGGLQLTPAFSSPFFSEDVGVDKEAVVRDALKNYSQVAFAGDGPPDLAPALLVAPMFRFARGHLANALSARGEGYRSFTRWAEIAASLARVASA